MIMISGENIIWSKPLTIQVRANSEISFCFRSGYQPKSTTARHGLEDLEDVRNYEICGFAFDRLEVPPYDEKSIDACVHVLLECKRQSQQLRRGIVWLEVFR